jgi:hypothetical protein
VQCPNCRLVVAREVRCGALVLLQVGPLVLREFHGVCAACGTEVHYSVSDRVIAALLHELDIGAILETTK